MDATAIDSLRTSSFRDRRLVIAAIPGQRVPRKTWRPSVRPARRTSSSCRPDQRPPGAEAAIEGGSRYTYAPIRQGPGLASRGWGGVRRVRGPDRRHVAQLSAISARWARSRVRGALAQTRVRSRHLASSMILTRGAIIQRMAVQETAGYYYEARHAAHADQDKDGGRDARATGPLLRRAGLLLRPCPSCALMGRSVV
jgi:hypothetical protein